MNLKRLSIWNEIFIRRDLSMKFNPQLSLPCKDELSLKCLSGLKLNPDSCKLPWDREYITDKLQCVKTWDQRSDSAGAARNL